MCPVRPLEIERRQEGPATVVKLSGHISASEAEELSSYFNDLIEQGADLVVIDLKDVEIITSDGLGVLIRTRKALTESGGKLYLCGIHGNVLEVFQMTRLDKIFAVYDTPDSALTAASA